MTFLLQRKPDPASTAASQPADRSSAAVSPGVYANAIAMNLRSVGAALGSSSEPLPPEVRGDMEASFGQDLGGVRVHDGAHAAASAEAVGAQAYTVGSDVVFGRGRYAPGTREGGHLLAHELAHVVQQRGASPDGPLALASQDGLERDADDAAARAMRGGPARVAGTAPRSLQRQTVTGTRNTVTGYEVSTATGSPRQGSTGRGIAGPELGLAFDPATSTFTVTFHTLWIFPHGWTTAQRTAYEQAFQASVLRVWNNRFLLAESGTRRTAHVQIVFDPHVIPQLANETEELMEWVNPAWSGRWRMDVRNLGVRENVDRSARTVHLGATSNQQQTHSAAALRARAPFSYSGTGGSRSYTQAASPHEFGHMIGLGDEYLEDTDSVPSAARGHINNRIMNVGESVTPDAYAPFAEWLSGLTGTTWRVGSRA